MTEEYTHWGYSSTDSRRLRWPTDPRWVEGLHLLEAIVRSPLALATLLAAAGPGAEEQVGRIRARQEQP